MTREQVITLFRLIAGAWPGKFQYPSADRAQDAVTLEVWHTMFKSTDESIVQAALKKYIATGEKWPPAAGELVAIVNKATQPEKMHPAQAWQIVQRTIHRISPTYQPSEFMAALPEDIRRAVEIVGISRIANGDDDGGWLGREFAKVYQDLEQTRQDRQLSAPRLEALSE